MKHLFITLLTLIAFAANSLLCRMALGSQVIDPVSFTGIRLGSGALVLWLLSAIIREGDSSLKSEGSWISGIALFVYALAFSFAYITLSTGTGALILFGAVQVSMMASALCAGEKVSSLQWLGLVTAIMGLIYLVLPGLAAPDPVGAMLMGAAGVAWGVYSIRGKGASAPIAMTAGNFARSTPLMFVAGVVALSTLELSAMGVTLALISGVLTSGVGYVLWYHALRTLTTTQASIVQLTVPIIAAFAGVGFLSEQISARLLIASTLILGGVAIAVLRAPMQKQAPLDE